MGGCVADMCVLVHVCIRVRVWMLCDVGVCISFSSFNCQ